MATYIANRLLLAIPLILGITLITFSFISAAPGDPVQAMIDPEEEMSAANLERWKEVMGLNKQVVVRYVIWLGQLARGNFGYSYQTGEPVLRRIAVRLPATLELMGFALVASSVLGISLGVLAALKQYTIWDYVLTLFALFSISIPSFFLALLALYVFALKLEWFPTFGMRSVAFEAPPPLLDNLHHLVLPGVFLSLDLTAGLTRYMRSGMLEVLGQEYVTTARAKGLKETRVVIGHALRNALLPVITIVTLRLPILFGGTVIIETMFQWPGMGRMAIQAISKRDYPVLMGLTLVAAILVLFSNLIADILYAVADPRMRHE